MTFVGVEDRAPEGVELLAFVELPADPGAKLLVGEPGEDEVRLDEAPVLLQGLGERVAAAAGLQAGESSEAGAHPWRREAARRRSSSQ